MLLLWAMLTVPNVADLGSPEWSQREAAERQMRLMGFLAVPWLMEGERDGNPEIRDRCRRMLTPWRSIQADIEALAVLTSPWELQRPWELYEDCSKRRRIARLAERTGLFQAWEIRDINPDTECGGGWSPCGVRWMAIDVEWARAKIGGVKPWFLR